MLTCTVPRVGPGITKRICSYWTARSLHANNCNNIHAHPMHVCKPIPLCIDAYDPIVLLVMALLVNM